MATSGKATTGTTISKHTTGWYAGWTVGAIVVIALIAIGIWLGVRGGSTQPQPTPPQPAPQSGTFAVGVQAWNFQAASAAQSSAQSSAKRARKTAAFKPMSVAQPTTQLQAVGTSQILGGHPTDSFGAESLTCLSCDQTKAKKRVTFSSSVIG